METYKTPINIPRTGHELITCHYPLRIDTYSSCYHDCKYCYAKSILTNFNIWKPNKVRVANVKNIIKIISLSLEKKKKGIVAKAIQNRVPARLGGLTDCFQPIEKKEKVTIELIRYLNSIDYPYLIVTKSDLVADYNYLKTFRRDLAYIQVTVITLDENKARKLEPNAPSPMKRIKAIKNLIESGIFVAGRISPIIPNITDNDCFAVIDKFKEIGVPHIIFEFFRGNKQMIYWIENATKTNISDLQKGGFYFRIDSHKKEIFYKKILEKMKNSKTSFTFCSDGDPVPFHLHSTRNCCGTDTLRRIIPETKFNNGNEKVASNVYFELVEKSKISLEDLKGYFSLSDEIFEKHWNNGSLEKFVPNCKWCKTDNFYFLESSKQNSK